MYDILDVTQLHLFSDVVTGLERWYNSTKCYRYVSSWFALRLIHSLSMTLCVIQFHPFPDVTITLVHVIDMFHHGLRDGYV